MMRCLRRVTWRGSLATLLLLLLSGAAAHAADPVVSNVRAGQRPGTRLVDISYDVSDADSAALTVTIAISSDGGTTWGVPCTSVSGSGVGPAVSPGTGKAIVWDAGADWGGQWSESMRVRVTADDGSGGLPPAGDYLLVDLSAGSSASSYPVSTLDAVPAGGWTDVHKKTTLVLRRIPAGTFTMGSPTGELGRDGNETQHQVTLTKDFYIGVFEVTQRQWYQVMGTWPSWFNNAAYRDTRPVDLVSWNDIRGGTWPGGQPGAAGFIGRLRARTGIAFDLPSESQWEYACRAGTTTALNSGKNLTSTGNCPNMAAVGRYYFNGGSGQISNGDLSVATAGVGSYQANAWGLYDMHGNVWEWCLDWYGTYPATVSDPLGASLGSYRVLRGGCWLYYAIYCRAGFRNWYGPDNRINYIGFRACSAAPSQ